MLRDLFDQLAGNINQELKDQQCIKVDDYIVTKVKWHLHGETQVDVAVKEDVGQNPYCYVRVETSSE